MSLEIKEADDCVVGRHSSRTIFTLSVRLGEAVELELRE